MESKDEIMIVSQETLVNKIYTIRGQKVMLDFELAEIYGYETKNFNRQVKNNNEKFEGEDFMFQLKDDEVEDLSRCKNFTLNRGTGRGSNIKYNPYAFTEVSDHRIDAQPFTGNQTARRFEMGCNVRKTTNVSMTMG